MNNRKLWAGSAAIATVALFLAPVAEAADGGGSDVQVTNTETLQVYVNSDGSIQSKRVYEQLALTGNGNVDFQNPVGTNGIRNIDGRGGRHLRRDGHEIVVPVGALALCHAPS